MGEGDVDIDTQITNFLKQANVPSVEHEKDPHKDIQSKLHALGFRVFTFQRQGATDDQLTRIKEGTINLLREKYPSEEQFIKGLVEKSDIYSDTSYIFNEPLVDKD